MGVENDRRTRCSSFSSGAVVAKITEIEFDSLRDTPGLRSVFGFGAGTALRGRFSYIRVSPTRIILLANIRFRLHGS